MVFLSIKLVTFQKLQKHELQRVLFVTVEKKLTRMKEIPYYSNQECMLPVSTITKKKYFNTGFVHKTHWKLGRSAG